MSSITLKRLLDIRLALEQYLSDALKMCFKIRSQNPLVHLCMGLDFEYSEIPPDLKDRTGRI